jgi:glycerol-3-phosphate dehydrogenase
MDSSVCVIGGGVVGSATALALARRGVAVTLLEAEPALALAATGTNSGILHTGFDSKPGTLETRLILRSASLRDAVLDTLEVPVLRCGAVLRAHGDAQRRRIGALEANARMNGVTADLDDADLIVPGEIVTDPVAYTLALAAAAQAHGATIRTGARVTALESTAGGVRVRCEDGAEIAASAAVNAAGLHADDISVAAGQPRPAFRIYPRKGEFLVFDPPGGAVLEQILLPIPDRYTKGVLVFPTLDGKIVAGPTAVDQEDKRDWSVRPEAQTEVSGKAAGLLPALAGAEPIARYAGLRPAGVGLNYVIEPSAVLPELLHVAAIRSTGLSASLGIADHVTGLLAARGVAMGEQAPLRRGAAPEPAGPWWRRSADHWAAAAGS